MGNSRGLRGYSLPVNEIASSPVLHIDMELRTTESRIAVWKDWEPKTWNRSL